MDSTTTPTQSEKIAYKTPQKEITEIETLNKFLESRPFIKFLDFLEALSTSIKGKPSDTPCVVSPFVESVCVILRRLGTWIDEIKPTQQTGRFANPAYRTWFDRLVQNVPALMKEILPEKHHDAIIELVTYFQASWGDRTRMDYGTGHELNFAVWLYCLQRIGAIAVDDYPAVVLKIFLTYLDVMRKLQTTYWLEPAGSKGVWALDDYHFLPFYFGASQLIDHPHIKPKAIRSADVYEAYHKKYLFLGCIKYINQVKTGPFFEHSPTLDGIGNVPNWEKVNSGLMKMYKGEVLCKLPVMQHFFTGGILPLSINS